MKFFKLAMPGLGLLFLGYLIGKLGPDEILRNFALMKWSFPLILLLACSWHITNSLAWSFAFPSGAFRPRFRMLIMAKLAGDAVNQLTPLANIGGEPIKAYLLKRESPTSRGLASVVINKTAQVMTGLLFTTVGLGLVILHNLRAPYEIPIALRLSLAGLLLAGACLLWLFFMKQQHMFSSLLNIAHRLGINTRLLESRMAKAASIDDNIKRFYRDCKGRFLLVLLCHALGWLLGACETFVILKTLVASTDFQIAFLITSLTVVINSLFFFMPSNIGVLEGGQVFLFLTLGLNPAMGLSLGIVKRMRKIFWMSIGWLFLTRMSRGVLEADIVDRSRRSVAIDSELERSNRLNYP